MRWIVAAWIALASASTARAELVYFARGGQAQIDATIEGDRVRLDTPGGPMTFDRDEFRSIIPGHRPDRDWAERRAAAVAEGSSAGRFSAAWWALENGLTPEATGLLEESRSIAPGHGPTRRGVAMLDAMALPCPSPDLDSVGSRLRGLRFSRLESRHVLLLHQSSEAEGRERLDVIERVVATFCLSFAAQGVSITPPSSKLVSVQFAEKRDYVAFLRASDADAFVTTQGYYHPTLRAVFAYDTRGDEPLKTRRRAIENRRKAGDPASDLDRRSLLFDLEWRANDLGIVAHETVHQLVDLTGLAPRFDDFPSWLHEGLASQFEVVRGGRWAGFGRANDLRLPDWRAIRPGPRLDPLVRGAGFGQGYRREVYAQSWGLVAFLRKTRPREFLTFLDLLRLPPTEGREPPERHLGAFRSAFGDDLPGLERAWRDYLSEVRTPLEAGESRLAPPAPSP